MINISDRRMALVTAWGFALALSSGVSFLTDKLLADTYTMQKPGVLSWQFIGVAALLGALLQRYLVPTHDAVTSHKVVKYISTKFFENGGFIAKPTPWIQHNLVYGIVLEEDEGFERVLGVAKLFMVQENKLIQLMVLARYEKAASIWQRLDSGETDQVKNIKLKMGVPHE